MQVSSRRSNPAWGLLAGLTAAAIWGGMYVVSKVVMAVIPPFSLIVTRLVLGILTLAIIVVIRKGWKVSPPAVLADLWCGIGWVWHFSRLSICRHEPLHGCQRLAGYLRHAGVRPALCRPCCWRKGSPSGACWHWVLPRLAWWLS